MQPCKYATPTNRPWSACNCTEIECRNARRLQALLPGCDGRADGASFHSRYRVEDADHKEDATVVLVRSAYCNQNHCIDFQSPD